MPKADKQSKLSLTPAAGFHLLSPVSSEAEINCEMAASIVLLSPRSSISSLQSSTFCLEYFPHSDFRQFFILPAKMPVIGAFVLLRVS